LAFGVALLLARRGEERRSRAVRMVVGDNVVQPISLKAGCFFLGIAFALNFLTVSCCRKVTLFTPLASFLLTVYSVCLAIGFSRILYSISAAVSITMTLMLATTTLALLFYSAYFTAELVPGTIIAACVNLLTFLLSSHFMSVWESLLTPGFLILVGTFYGFYLLYDTREITGKS